MTEPQLVREADTQIHQPIQGSLPPAGYIPLASRFFETDPTLGTHGERVNSRDLAIGDTFVEFGKMLVHVGYYSAVYHIIGEAQDGQRHIVSRHLEVNRVRRAQGGDGEEAFNEASRIRAA